MGHGLQTSLALVVLTHTFILSCKWLPTGYLPLGDDESNGIVQMSPGDRDIGNWSQ